LGEEPRCHLADDPELVGPVLEDERAFIDHDGCRPGLYETELTLEDQSE